MDVVADLANIIQSEDDMMFEPQHVDVWAHVESVVMPELREIMCESPLDLRYGRWEPYERQRHVPIAQAGVLLNMAVLPMSADPVIAQRRIHNTANLHQYRQLHITNGDSWFVETFNYPQDIVDALNELDDMQRNEEQDGQWAWQGGGNWVWRAEREKGCGPRSKTKEP